MKVEYHPAIEAESISGAWIQCGQELSLRSIAQNRHLGSDLRKRKISRLWTRLVESLREIAG